MPKIEVYSKGYCPFCKMTKSTLRDLGLKFQEIDITNNPKRQQEMNKRSKRRTVPQIFINNQHVGGNDDLQIALSNGKLKKLLQAS